MSIPKRKFIEVKLRGIMSTLERTPSSDKKNPMSMGLAIEFNKVRREIEEEYPELKGELPSEINTRGPGSSMGIATASFLDLEISCEQLLNLLSLVADQ